MTVLPASAKEVLRAHLDDVRRLHTTDCANGYGRVVLPFAVARKYPSSAMDWRWQFVFPAARICRDSRFGAPSLGDIRVFYDVTETQVQVLAIVTKAEAQSWLDEHSTPAQESEGSGSGRGEG